MVATEAAISRQHSHREVLTSEGCYIIETWNVDRDADVSIARARVAPGVTTAWHALEGIVERYLVISGAGEVDVEGLEPCELVGPGDVVVIPANARQRIRNSGTVDLVFYCICNPRFSASAYRQFDD